MYGLCDLVNLHIHEIHPMRLRRGNKHIHCLTIHNDPKLETTQISVYSKKYKQTIHLMKYYTTVRMNGLQVHAKT